MDVRSSIDATHGISIVPVESHRRLVTNVPIPGNTLAPTNSILDNENKCSAMWHNLEMQSVECVLILPVLITFIGFFFFARFLQHTVHIDSSMLVK